MAACTSREAPLMLRSMSNCRVMRVPPTALCEVISVCSDLAGAAGSRLGSAKEPALTPAWRRLVGYQRHVPDLPILRGASEVAMISVIFEVFPATAAKTINLNMPLGSGSLFTVPSRGIRMDGQLPLSHPANGFLESRERASRKIAAFCSLHFFCCLLATASNNDTSSKAVFVQRARHVITGEYPVAEVVERAALTNFLSANRGNVVCNDLLRLWRFKQGGAHLTSQEGPVAYDRSPVKPIGAIVIAGLSLGTISPIISTAATLEEVAHCRAIEKATQRVSCFKSLKPGPKANTGDAAAAKTERAASENPKGRSLVTRQDAAATHVSDVVRVKTKSSAAAKR
jgi:hypothetical protein